MICVLRVRARLPLGPQERGPSRWHRGHLPVRLPPFCQGAAAPGPSQQGRPRAAYASASAARPWAPAVTRSCGSLPQIHGGAQGELAE